MNKFVENLRSYTVNFEPWWTIIGAPISQEIIFRFIPYQIYLKIGNYWVVGIISSIIYALIHFYFGWQIVLGTFVLGLVLWFVMVNYGLVPAILVHVLVNIAILIFWSEKWLAK